MNESKEGDTRQTPDAAEFPRAKVGRRGWRFPMVWLVPVVAALVAAYLMYDSVREFGPLITIQFNDVNGLKSGQTLAKYRGVPIGKVVAIELAADRKVAVVKLRLHRSAAPIARKDSVFWIVRPEVGFSNISGLGTVITGPEIGVQPGGGALTEDFVGLDNAPVAPDSRGLSIVLHSPHLGSVKANSPVHYRGVVVGTVLDARLSADANSVDVHILILPRYVKLVRTGSRFWKAGGIDVNVSLFSGLEISVESLRSLVAGGIAFATPPAGTGPVANGAVFPLFDKPDKEWLDWAPQIAIGKAPGS